MAEREQPGKASSLKSQATCYLGTAGSKLQPSNHKLKGTAGKELQASSCKLQGEQPGKSCKMQWNSREEVSSYKLQAAREHP